MILPQAFLRLHKLQPIISTRSAFVITTKPAFDPDIGRWLRCSGLGHHSFISGYNQRNDIDTARSGEHILIRPLMARDIDDADVQIVFR